MVNRPKLTLYYPHEIYFKTKKSVLWIWFFGSFLQWLYQFLLQVMPNVMIAPMSKSLNVSTLGVSVLSSAFYFYTYIVLQIPAGIMVDRLNIRYVCIALV